jgi:hypothetical protein
MNIDEIVSSCAISKAEAENLHRLGSAMKNHPAMQGMVLTGMMALKLYINNQYTSKSPKLIDIHLFSQDLPGDLEDSFFPYTEEMDFLRLSICRVMRLEPEEPTTFYKSDDRQFKRMKLSVGTIRNLPVPQHLHQDRLTLEEYGVDISVASPGYLLAANFHPDRYHQQVDTTALNLLESQNQGPNLFSVDYSTIVSDAVISYEAMGVTKTQLFGLLTKMHNKYCRHNRLLSEEILNAPKVDGVHICEITQKQCHPVKGMQVCYFLEDIYRQLDN